MQTLSPQLSDKDATVMILSLLMAPEQATYFYQFLSEVEAAALEEETQRLLHTPYEQLTPVLQSELKAMMDYDYVQDVLSSVNAEWLARSLQNEKPHMIARVLEALPNLLRGELTASLPKSLLLRLPRTSHLPAISPALQKVVLNSFLKQFQAVGAGEESGTFLFRDIVHLEGEDVLSVVKEMGLTMFATAFQGVDSKYLQKLCARMPREDERQLMEAVQSIGQMPSEEIKAAQKSILALGMSSTREGWLFKEAGLRELAKCFAPEHPRLGEHISFKLDKEMGELLLKQLEECRKQPALDLLSRLKLQDFVVRCVQRLAYSDRIDSRWNGRQFLLYFGT